MEFFATASVSASAERLQQALTIADLPAWCASVYAVRKAGEQVGEIETVWGVFTVSREPIAGGVRFTLPGCPNAFTWSVTTDLPPDPDAVVVHATINRRAHDPDFVASIEAFVQEWADGLQRGLA